MLALLLATLLSSGPPEPPPRSVYAGVFLRDVSNFDLKQGRFQADLELWLKWAGDPAVPQLAFDNGELSLREEISRESEGDWHAIRWRVQGVFRGTFPLQDFPFDRQALPLSLVLPSEAGALVPDLASSGMAREFSITGWIYEPFFRAEQGQVQLATDLGSIRGEGLPSSIQHLHFKVDLRRPLAAYVLKLLIPLLIIVGMAFLGFFLPADLIDVRSAIGVTALLSCVAFHLSQAGTLPEVPYLVLADRLFIGAYAIIFLSTVESVIAYNLGARDQPRGRRLDQLCYGLFPAAVLVASLWGLRPSEPAPPPSPGGSPRATSPARSGSGEGGRELVVGLGRLASLNQSGIAHLLRRGLANRQGDGTLAPHLAEELPGLTNSAVRFLPGGGMWVRWRLKPGLRWSDGSAITAGDLAFSVALVEDPDRRSVQVTDERTLELEYARRLPRHLQPFPVYPKRSAAPVAADGGVDAVNALLRLEALPGDGPFILRRFAPGEEAVFEPNPHFAGPSPRLRRLVLREIGGGRGAEVLRSGEAHYVGNLGPASAAELSSTPGITLHEDPGDLLLFLQPDLSVPALADLRVRKALLHAIDRESVGRWMYGEGARIADGYLSLEARDRAPDLPSVERDVPAARELLRQAKVRLPLRLPLWVTTAPASSNYALVVNQLVAEAAEVGIELSATPQSSAQMLEHFLSGDHGGVLLYSRRHPELPALFFNLPYAQGRHDTETPRPHFGPEVVELYQRLQATLFEERRLLLSRRLQHEWARQYPLLPLVFGVDRTAAVSTLEGRRPGETGAPWWNVEEWSNQTSPPRPPPL